jgi:hypothetical protein
MILQWVIEVKIEEKFEDTKGATRSRNSKKNKKYKWRKGQINQAILHKKIEQPYNYCIK